MAGVHGALGRGDGSRAARIYAITHHGVVAKRDAASGPQLLAAAVVGVWAAVSEDMGVVGAGHERDRALAQTLAEVRGPPALAIVRRYEQELETVQRAQGEKYFVVAIGRLDTVGGAGHAAHVLQRGEDQSGSVLPSQAVVVAPDLHVQPVGRISGVVERLVHHEHAEAAVRLHNFHRGRRRDGGRAAGAWWNALFYRDDRTPGAALVNAPTQHQAMVALVVARVDSVDGEGQESALAGNVWVAL